jgi:hypothetical protein
MHSINGHVRISAILFKSSSISNTLALSSTIIKARGDLLSLTNQLLNNVDYDSCCFPLLFGAMMAQSAPLFNAEKFPFALYWLR